MMSGKLNKIGSIALMVIIYTLFIIVFTLVVENLLNH